MKRTLTFIIFLSMLLFYGCTAAKETLTLDITKENDTSKTTQPRYPVVVKWEEDIEYLREELPKRHKNLFFKLTKEEFNTMLDELINDLPSLQENHFRIRIAEIIASVGDTHTYYGGLEKINTNNLYPLLTYWFKDGLYVISADRAYGQYLGCKLLKINGKSIEDIITDINTLISHENEAQLKLKNPYLIINPTVLEYFNVIEKGKKPVFSLEKPDKTVVTVEIGEKYFQSMNMVSLMDGLKEKPLYLQKDDWFWFTYVPEDKLLYVQYNRCWDKNLEKRMRNNYNRSVDALPDFEVFSEDLLDAVEKNEIDKLVFDMRNNPGGNSQLGHDLIRKLSKIDKVNKKGKLFVIVGRTTFSSATLNTLDFANYTNAVFYGEPTSGKPNHYGEVKELTLPNSNIYIGYSTKYFEYYHKDIDSFIPDFIIEPTYEEWSRGIDPVLEAIKSYEN
ncbi:MAG: peptidase S41 [Bacillota bacterium]